MKEEICKQFEELLKTEDVAAIKSAARDLQNDYKAESAKEKQLQQEAWDKEEHEEGEEFEYKQNPLDDKFYEFVGEYRERVKIHGQKLAEERENNLKLKQSILKELEELISTEENIGKAFGTFNELMDKWKEIGDIPGDKHREIQDEIHRAKENFYYNINIYKALQENDLKINHDKKLDLITKIKEVLALDSIKESELLVKGYRKEWDEIGPSPREDYKELGDEFFEVTRQIYDKIQKHYDSIHEEQDANLELKKGLVNQLKQVVGLEITQHNTWKKKTDEILALQQEWKKVGFARKKDNEEVWQEFRGLCDLFFDKKKEFYNKRKAESGQNAIAKKELVEKAEALADSQDWKQSTEALIALQKKWKNVGAAGPGDDHQLWKSFRAACDKFFNAKKEHFSKMDGEQEENLKAKLALVEEIEKSELGEDKTANLKMLQDFANKWRSIGFIPKSKLSEVFDRYNKAMDGKYDKLNLERAERSKESYKERIENLKHSEDGDRALRKEKHILREKIDRLKQRILQYENNLEIFTGSGAAALKKDIEKKIRNTQREIDEIIDKMKML